MSLFESGLPVWWLFVFWYFVDKYFEKNACSRITNTRPHNFYQKQKKKKKKKNATSCFVFWQILGNRTHVPAPQDLIIFNKKKNASSCLVTQVFWYCFRTWDIICYATESLVGDEKSDDKLWGGYSNYFWRGCAARGLKPLPIPKDFLPQKRADLTCLFVCLFVCFLFFVFFFEIFANRDPFLRVFIPQKRLILPFFFNFCEMEPLLRIFFFEQNETHV